MVDVEREVPYLAREGFDSPSRALVMPFKQSVRARPGGFLVAGLNSGRPLDEDYRAFASLAAGHIAAAIADATAFAAERRRARALAELDRAKSAFFANVSHELRTPLTLMLGPLDDALSAPGGLGQEQVTLVRRNGRRLLKLVNTLLDLSRLEAGRLGAAFRPVDLSALTSDLAAAFSEATERAGLELRIACGQLGEPVYVDPDLWEQIVLNLVSNAFKFTLEGRITVELRAIDGHAELAVSDTGSGIPAHEVERVFERFHRITTHQARSHEGAGIGLALVRELVELHGGTVSVQSTVGKGSRFVLRVPFGRAHLPAGQIQDDDGLPLMMSGSLFVDEALAWLPEAGSAERGPLAGEITDRAIAAPAVSAGRSGTSGAHVMIVDDNSGMRAYLTRLLSPHWQVETVDNGTTALERVRDHPPDLLVADVMMSGLGGLELLGALRADPATRELPVIVLGTQLGSGRTVPRRACQIPITTRSTGSRSLRRPAPAAPPPTAGRRSSSPISRPTRSGPTSVTSHKSMGYAPAGRRRSWPPTARSSGHSTCTTASHTPPVPRSARSLSSSRVQRRWPSSAHTTPVPAPSSSASCRPASCPAHWRPYLGWRWRLPSTRPPVTSR
jgi:signal transduction histidine kinase